MDFEIKRQMLLKRIRRRCESILFLCIHILVLTMYTDVWLNSTYSSGLGWGEETLTLQQNYLSEHNYVLSMSILRETMVIPPNRVLHMTWAKQPYFWKYMSSQGGYFEGDKIILVLSVCKTCRSRSQTHPVVYQTKGKRERERFKKQTKMLMDWKLETWRSSFLLSSPRALHSSGFQPTSLATPSEAITPLMAPGSSFSLRGEYLSSSVYSIIPHMISSNTCL